MDTSNFVEVPPSSGSEYADRADEAATFVSMHGWCENVSKVYLALDVTPSVCLFLVQFKPKTTGMDSEVWIPCATSIRKVIQRPTKL
jgi:hypothetical protein